MISLVRYAVVRKNVSKEVAVDSIKRSIDRIRKVYFFVVSKCLENNQFEVVIEVTSSRKLAVRQKYWEEEEYQKQDPEKSNRVEVKEGEVFRVKLDGNIKDISGRESIKMTYQKSRTNYYIFRAVMTEPCADGKGSVEVARITSVEETIDVLYLESSCWRSKKVIRQEKLTLTSFETIVALPVFLDNHSEVTTLSPARTDTEYSTYPMDYEEQEEQNQLKSKYNIPKGVVLAIPVLSPSSIANFTRKLNVPEIGFFALQIGIELSRAMAISDSDDPHKSLELILISRYRRTGGASKTKVHSLVKGLKAINRRDLADEIEYALENDLPISP